LAYTKFVAAATRGPAAAALAAFFSRFQSDAIGGIIETKSGGVHRGIADKVPYPQGQQRFDQPADRIPIGARG
jgi:hypothetical protein